MKQIECPYCLSTDTGVVGLMSDLIKVKCFACFQPFFVPVAFGSSTIITVICCICKKDLGTKDGQGVSGISHGFCDDCQKIELAKIKDSPTSLKEVQP